MQKEWPMNTKKLTLRSRSFKKVHTLLCLFLISVSVNITAQENPNSLAVDTVNKLATYTGNFKIFKSNNTEFDYPTEIKTRKNPVSFKTGAIAGMNSIVFAHSTIEQAHDFESHLREYLASKQTVINIDCIGTDGECGFYTPREFIRTQNRQEIFAKHSNVFNLNRDNYKIISAFLEIDDQGQKTLVTVFIIKLDNSDDNQIILDWTTPHKNIADTSQSYIQVQLSSPEAKAPTQKKGLYVYFDIDSDIPKSSQSPTIEHIAQIIKETPNSAFKIIGHTDNTGDSTYNAGLAKKRAKSFANILIEQFNIPKDQLNIDSKGSSSPKADNTSESLRALNRRVEIIMNESSFITRSLSGELNE